MNLWDAMENEVNTSITENGMVGYKSQGHKLVDLNFSVSSLRNVEDEHEIIDAFFKAFNENETLAIRWLFYARDCREGLGERNLFKVVMKWLFAKHYDVSAFMDCVMEFGRADDLFFLLDTPYDSGILEWIKDKLHSDMSSDNPSLLAKWLPSVNSSSTKTKTRAKKIYRYLGWTEKYYRQTLSTLRRKLNVVERQMSSNNWNNINYSSVPSKANLIYNRAFIKHDEERRNEFLKSVVKGTEKVNSSVLYPYEIVNDIRNIGYSLNSQAMWDNLPNYVNGDETTLVVADGSGSMDWATVGKSKVTPWDVAHSLAIYFAERCKGCFHNRYITFSSRPQLVAFDDSWNLDKKLQTARCYSECTNTNIERTLMLVLDTAINNHLSQEDMPKNLLIISDMEFDGSSYNNGRNVIENCITKFKEAGYSMPRLVFWNVCSRTQTIPVKENKNGVALVSGFSPSVCKMVLSDELDPYKLVVKAISDSRYDCVEEVWKSLNTTELPY